MAEYPRQSRQWVSAPILLFTMEFSTQVAVDSFALFVLFLFVFLVLGIMLVLELDMIASNETNLFCFSESQVCAVSCDTTANKQPSTLALLQRVYLA